MAEFGSQITQAPDLAVHNTAKEGVVTQSPSGNIDNSGFATAFNAAGDAFDEAGAIFANRKKSAKEKALADFTRQQLKIADAYDQGGIKSAAEARARMRTNLLNAMEASPDDHEFSLALIEAQNKILGIEGGAKIVSDRTDEENLRNAQKQKLIDQGLIGVNHSEAELDTALNTLQIANAAQQKYDERMRTINLAKSNIELSDAQRKMNERQEQQATREYFRDFTNAGMMNMNATFKDIINSDMSPADKVALIEQEYTNFLADVAPAAAVLPDSERGLYITPFERTKDLYLQLANGSLTLETLENSNKAILETQTAILLENPDIATAAAGSKLFDFGAFDFGIQQRVISPFMELMGNNNKNPNPETPPGVGTGNNPFDGNGETAKAYKELLRISDAALDEGNAELTENTLFNIDAVLGNIADAEASLRQEAKNGIDFVSVLATPSFGKMMKEHGDRFQNTEEAARIIEEHYVDEVLGMVEREFTSQQVVDVEAARQAGGEGDIRDFTDPLSDKVTYETTSAGMQFVAVDPTNPGAVAKARELNQTLKPIINTTVQAASNLQGDLNYGAAWERMAERLLGPQVGPAADDDELLFEDFQSGELDPKFEPVVALLDKTETGDGDYDTLLGHSDNNQFKDVKVSEMTLDEVIGFQKSPAYRNFSKGHVGRVATPVGRYQIVGKTLESLKSRLNLSGEEMFDKDLQDQLFVALFNERLRRSNGNVNEAVRQLRQEWEGFKHISTSQLKKALKGVV